LERARNDWKRLVTTGGFEIDINLMPKGQNNEYSIKGLFSKHHVSLNSEGLQVNGENIRITIIEADLVALGYPYRNNLDKVSMFNHFATFTDSSGLLKTYKIKEVYPDETVGVITCILSNYGTQDNISIIN
jgi:hypothetical protein